jgi:hypothetical protein
VTTPAGTTPAGTTPAGRVRIWRQPDDRWRWSYVEPGRDGTAEVDLISHRAYESFDEARGSAEAAYPGTAVETTTDPPGIRPPPRALRLLVALLVLAYLVRRRLARAAHHFHR